MRYFDRDISWLQFNERVLLEAAKKDVPLFERISFLSIFSSNLDEFFRVRYPALKIAAQTKTADKKDSTLALVKKTIKDHQNLYGHILKDEILPELIRNGVHLMYDEVLNEAQSNFASDYFYTQILSFLQPIVLGENDSEISLQNNALYFMVALQKGAEESFAVVNIPDQFLSRFISISGDNGMHTFLFLDDMLRNNIAKVFPAYTVSECYSIKMTRSADIDIVDENSDLFEEHLLDMIRNRESGTPTRMLYEGGMPVKMINVLAQYFNLDSDSLVEGGRYHNLKDLSKLPNPIGDSFRYKNQVPLKHSKLSAYSSTFEAIDQGDYLLHFPYHSYRSILRFFNEAAIDPLVSEISVTLYRVAVDSFITNALISAAKNGKKVTAFVELKARFDESNNLNWAKKMKVAGVKIIYSIPGIKVHAKLALVKRKEGFKSTYYGLVSTGNFNEQTARFYTDHILLTRDVRLTKEMDLLFAFLSARQQPKEYTFLKFPNLLVAGFNFLDKLTQLVDREIAHQQAGLVSHITIKLNNLEEREAIELLYKASNAGVKVDLIIRGICCLRPGLTGMSENITVRKIIGRYLEHSRVFIFENAGRKEVFIGSADLMTRNIRRRIEVIAPVFDLDCQKELLDIVRLQMEDNVQAVQLKDDGTIQTPSTNTQEKLVIAQEEIYHYTQTL